MHSTFSNFVFSCKIRITNKVNDYLFEIDKASNCFENPAMHHVKK